MFKANPSESAADRITKKGKGKKSSMFAKIKKPAPKLGNKINIFQRMGNSALNEG